MTDATADTRIEQTRTSLSDKLDELRRRAKRVRTWMTPSTYWSHPAIRFGVGLLAGYALGSRRSPASSGQALVVARPPSILHAMVRAGLAAATAAIVRRALDRDDDQRAR